MPTAPGGVGVTRCRHAGLLERLRRPGAGRQDETERPERSHRSRRGQDVDGGARGDDEDRAGGVEGARRRDPERGRGDPVGDEKIGSRNWFAAGSQEEDPPHLAAARASVTRRCAPRARSRSASSSPQVQRVRERPRRLVLEQLGAVEGEDPGAEDERPALARRCKGGDGRAAPGAKSVQEAPLGRGRGVRERVVERREGCGGVGVAPPAGDSECALSGAEKEFVERDPEGDPLAEREAVAFGAGQDARVGTPLFETAQADVDVPGHRERLEIGPQAQELGHPSRDRRSDPAP